MQPNKALQLTSHSSLQSNLVKFGIETWRFERAAEALWLAAERRSVIRPEAVLPGRGRSCELDAR